MTRKKVKLSKNIYLLVTAITIVAIGATILLLARHDSNKSVSTIPSTNPVASNKTTSSSNGQNTSSSSDSSSSQPDKNASNTRGNGSGPVKPFGVFVSNHHPGQNGSPTSETSACNTTPRASCYIKFTKGDVIKQLSAKTVDSNGAALWDWDVNQAGLTTGTWQVTAAATLNGQTQSTTDPLALEIQ